jgi:hypothetical protein
VAAADVVADHRRVDVVVPGELVRASLSDCDGEVVGRLTRRRQGLQAQVEISAEPATGIRGVFKLVVLVANTGTGMRADATRDQALASSLVACHILMEADGGTFISLLDPPEWAEAAAQACRNVGTFPVLTGPAGCTRTMLSSPIILYDHPRVAPESPGDLFDAAEIDEILSLRTLTLTDEEKAEARATGLRATEIIDRIDALPAPGARVVLRPRRRGTDSQDMFLAGRTATVAGVMTDIDGTRFLAVTVDGDPRADIASGPSRLRHFLLDEVERL